jgi:NAD-dependent dihydropyrimidine dehydrogenase PreA subunit
MAQGPWFPTIFSDQCDGCTGAFKCVAFCPHGVLEIRDAKAVVANPLGCIDGCSACASLCPQDAIRFPSTETIRNSTAKRSLLHRVVCRGCGKRFSTDRNVEYCFDCEGKGEVERQAMKEERNDGGSSCTEVGGV